MMFDCEKVCQIKKNTISFKNTYVNSKLWSFKFSRSSHFSVIMMDIYAH